MKEIADIISRIENNSQSGRLTYDNFNIVWFFKTAVQFDHAPRFFERINMINKKTKFPGILQIIKYDLGKTISKIRISQIERSKEKKGEKFRRLSKTGNKSADLSRQDASKKSRILWLVYSNALLKNGEIDRVNSAVEEIKKSRNLEFFHVITEPLSSQNLVLTNQNKFHDNYLHCFLDDNIIKNSLKNAEELSKAWKNMQNSLENKNEISWQYSRWIFDFFFSEEMIGLIIKYYETFKKIIMENRIKCVCLTNETGIIDRCLLAAAHKCNVPSFVIQHGIGSHTVFPDTFSSTKFLVPGEKYRENLIKTGIKKDRIFITGPVFFDYLAKYKKKGSLLKKTENTEKNILFITSPIVEDGYRKKEDYFGHIEKYLNELWQSEPKPKLTIKPHPRERFLHEYDKIAKRNNINLKIVVSRDSAVLYDLITNSDIVIGSNSTVLLESALLGKKVINIDLHGIGNSEKFISLVKNNKLAAEMNLNDNLAELIQKIDKDKKIINLLKNAKNRFIKKHCYNIDGKAGQRTAEIIKMIVINTKTADKK